MFALLEVRCCRKKQGDLSRAHLVVDVDNRFVVDAFKKESTTHATRAKLFTLPTAAERSVMVRGVAPCVTSDTK